MNPNGFQTSVPLKKPDRDRLLDRLDAARPGTGKQSARKQPRYSYRVYEIPVLAYHPGGTIGRYLVLPRNLSASGMSFIHGAFLHTHTRLTLSLISEQGKARLVEGRVIRARHISKHIHEVHVGFDRMIDPHEFIPEAATTSDVDIEVVPDALTGLGDLPAVRGIAGYFGDDSPDFQRDMSIFEAAGLTAHALHTTGALLDVLQTHKLDIIIGEARLDGQPIEEVVRRIRTEGHYRGPILGVFEDGATRPADIGFAATLRLPLDPAGSLTVIASEIQKYRGTADLLQPMLPNGADPDDAAAFANQATLVREKLVSALRDGDLALLAKACASLARGSRSTGYAPLADAASQAAAIVDEGDATNPLLRRRVQHLIALCGMLNEPDRWVA